MPRRPRPVKTKRSEHWLRMMVNEAPDVLDTAITSAYGWIDIVIDWRSPRQDDDYAEYYDDAFLERLGGTKLIIPLAEFWPRSGPRWDGLGRTSDGKLILVEAKAHIAQAVDHHSKATGNALGRIEQRLDEAKAAFGASHNACWHTPFYQMANRLAHLHFLAGINGQDAYLVFLYFANAPDVPKPVSTEEWRGAIRLAHTCLGLKKNKLTRRMVSIIVDLQHGSGPPFSSKA